VHEWALAEGVVITARKLAEKEEFSRVTKLVVRIGELQRISPDFFRQALTAVLPEDDARLAAVELEFTLEQAGFECRKCSRHFSLDEAGGDLGSDEQEAIHFVPEMAHGFMHCPFCTSPDFAVVRGRGIWIDRLEGER